MFQVRGYQLRNFLIVAWFSASIAGCATRNFTASQVPSKPFSTFGDADVSRFTFETSADAEPATAQDADHLAGIIQDRLRNRLKQSGLFDKAGRKLGIRGRLVTVDSGSRAARYFIGFGAGTGRVVAEVSLLDESGSMIAKGSAFGTVSGGLFGGSFDAAGKQVADSVFNFIKDNFNEVEAQVKK